MLIERIFRKEFWKEVVTIVAYIKNYLLNTTIEELY